MRLFRLLPLLAGIGLLPVASWLAFAGIAGRDDGSPSVCVGDAVNGSLRNGKQLPFSGSNFRVYHPLGFATGRTFVHSTVRDTIVDAYRALAKSDSDLQFVYAETGWPSGGRFRPHRTHANGTSVDFMVPLRGPEGAVAQVPSSVGNKLGYSVTFDDEGRRNGARIDFEAVGKHLLALDQAARNRGIAISRVIFEPPLLRHLFATTVGEEVRKRITFLAKPAWVRHDQHYHIDFAVPCEPR